jgi:hypothetical protein
VIKSVYLPFESIFLTMILFLTLEFSWTTVAFLWYREEYEGNCDSMAYCFLFNYDYTFKRPGGVGNVINDFHTITTDAPTFIVK